MAGFMKPAPLNASHDYQRQFSTDKRRYQKLSDQWIDVHECTFPIETLATGMIETGDFNICDDSVTFNVPFTKGVGWNRGSINQRYKDGTLPRYESRTFPLWQKLWLQYKIDALHSTCDDMNGFKSQLDQNNMRDLNNNLLGQLLGMLGTYNSDFCSCGDTGSGTETKPLLVEEGSASLSDIMFTFGESFKTECLPSKSYTMLLPQCYRSFFLRDKLVADQYVNCCAPSDNPAITGMMPDMYTSINGITVIFLRDEWFDKVTLADGRVAYKIPTFSTDSIAYKAARLDYTEIGADKEEDGDHYRWAFYYSMNVVLPEGIRNDWMVFERKTLQYAL